jgi:transcriptional regulator with XRE-family HTH domain
MVGYSQERLAEEVGVSVRSVKRWEARVGDPVPWMRPRLARALRWSLEQLDSALKDEAVEVGIDRGNLADALDATAADLDGMINPPPPDRPLALAVRRLKIAVPQRPGEREFVALEDSATAAQLSKIAHAQGMIADVEYIPVSGWIDLNRAGLLVVCGPKTSPITAAALSADPCLAFEQSSGRWELVERTDATRYASPMDDLEQPQHADIAYLGRLPCPDGTGTFLLIAGIHAIGSLGVAHYLAEHPDLMDSERKAKPFSMIVASRFDPAAKTITESRTLTDPLPHREA